MTVQPQPWLALVFGLDLPLPIVVQLDDKVRLDRTHHLILEPPTGKRVEVHQHLAGRLDHLDRVAGLLLDPRQTVLGQFVEMFVDQRGHHVAQGGGLGQLKHQAFANVTSPDSAGIELLNTTKHLQCPSL